MYKAVLKDWNVQGAVYRVQCIGCNVKLLQCCDAAMCNVAICDVECVMCNVVMCNIELCNVVMCIVLSWKQRCKDAVG